MKKSPAGGDGIVFLQEVSWGSRTRATMKAHPAALHPPSPLRVRSIWEQDTGDAQHKASPAPMGTKHMGAGHGRRKHPHPAQPVPRPYGYEGAFEAGSRNI